jgi:hypothetical protein
MDQLTELAELVTSLRRGAEMSKKDNPAYAHGLEVAADLLERRISDLRVTAGE